MNELDTFGKRVKWARKQAKLKQSELADKIGVKQSIISRIELEHVFNTSKVVELADALNVAVRWLKTGVGQSEPPRKVTRLDKLELALQKYNLSDEEIMEVEKAALEKAQEIFISK